MIDTKKFRTKTEIKDVHHVGAKNTWVIGLDIGYSGVNGWSPNCEYHFPFYAQELKNGLMRGAGSYEEDEIYYRDSLSGKEWIVGRFAQNQIKDSDTNVSEQAAFGRNRYDDPMFLVLTRVGIAIGMRNNSCGGPQGRKLALELGLPPQYLKADTEIIKEVLAIDHQFEVKIGDKPWKPYSFTLDANSITIMPQPMGTFISVSTNDDGSSSSNAKKYANSRTLIIDCGFGTLDTFLCENKAITSYETIDDLGMKAVLKTTVDKINKDNGTDFKVLAFQKKLEEGIIYKTTRKLENIKIEFADILEESSKKIFEKALNKLISLYNSFSDIDNIVITGGTGEAWYEYFTDRLKNLSHLSIVKGNENNEDSDFTFSNARGYYMFLVQKMRRMEGNK